MKLIRTLTAALLLAGTCGTAARAQEVDVPLPRPRPVEGESSPPKLAPTNTGVHVLLPQTRPDPQAANAGGEDTQESNNTSNAAPAAPPEPARIYQTACPAVLQGLVDADIQPPIADDGQCGIASPYLVRSLRVGGETVTLSSPITVNCQMATELAHWAGRLSAYTQAGFNAPVTAIMAGTSYHCRPRYNQDGNDLSEHGRGNALDLTGFVLGDGRRITLPGDWDHTTPGGRAMRFAHDAACGQFTTVLGPDANAAHRDHLHFDLGCHGQSCTARLCE